jgi:hypothetical protein
VAIDTINKRKSVLNVRLPFARSYPEPDGSLAASLDRQHIAGIYAGFTPQTGISADANNRTSIPNYLLPWHIPPVPDGDLGNRADRIHVAYQYRNIVPIGGTTNTDEETPAEQTLGPGVITFTSSSSAQGRTIIAPPLRGQNGSFWRPSISNAGIITLSDHATVAAGEAFAAFEDADGVLWPWEMDACSNAEVSTLVVTRGTAHRVSVRCTFTTGRDTDLPFRIYSIRPYLRIQNQDVPFGHEAHVEARIARPSIKVKHTGGPFVIDTINCRLKPLKNQVKG